MVLSDLIPAAISHGICSTVYSNPRPAWFEAYLASAVESKVAALLYGSIPSGTPASEHLLRCPQIPGMSAKHGVPLYRFSPCKVVWSAAVTSVVVLHIAQPPFNVLQGAVEGGFMGRTNKLVDGCYSFWQGGIFPLLQQLTPDYLAQCSVPHMQASSSPSSDASRSASIRGGAGLVVAEKDVLRLEGKDPVVQALDDLHRTKVVNLQ